MSWHRYSALQAPLWAKEPGEVVEELFRRKALWHGEEGRRKCAYDARKKVKTSNIHDL